MLTNTLEHLYGPELVFVSEPDSSRLAETAAALANTNGGTLLMPAGAAHLLEQVQAQCNPALPLTTRHSFESADGPLVAVQVARGNAIHALADGRVPVRSNQGSRPLSGLETHKLISDRAVGAFESDPVPGASQADLDPALVTAFVERRAQFLDQSPAADVDGLLHDLGAIQAQGDGITVAGLLLFGREPQRWLPDSGARFVRYASTDTAYPAVDLTLTGALVPLLDALWDHTHAHTNSYPGTALQETLVNAVCHRDYRLHGAPLTVCLFPDRLEITSPGGLPGYLTTDYLLHGHYSRNLRIAFAMRQWGYAQQTGKGMLRLLTSMDGHGYHPPELIAEPYRFTVRLYNGQNTPETPTAPTLNECQQRILAFVREHGSITPRQLQTLCASEQPAQRQRDLDDLVMQDQLRKVGRRSSAFYIIP